MGLQGRPELLRESRDEIFLLILAIMLLRFGLGHTAKTRKRRTALPARTA